MKALGLLFAVFALAAVVARPTHAGPHFAPRPPIKFGPRTAGLDRDHHRHYRNGVSPGWDEAPSAAPDPAPTPAPVVYATENVYVAAPVERETEPVRLPRPRILYLGVRSHARPSRPPPEIIYGDARP